MDPYGAQPYGAQPYGAAQAQYAQPQYAQPQYGAAQPNQAQAARRSRPGRPAELPAASGFQFAKLFVSGMPVHADESTLRLHFAHVGEVTDVFTTTRPGGKWGGTGFVQFKDEFEAGRAMEARPTSLLLHPIHLPPRASTPLTPPPPLSRRCRKCTA